MWVPSLRPLEITTLGKFEPTVMQSELEQPQSVEALAQRNDHICLEHQRMSLPSQLISHAGNRLHRRDECSQSFFNHKLLLFPVNCVHNQIQWIKYYMVL